MANQGAKLVKILYDISLLGRGAVSIEDRTGLFRFAEETLKCLDSSKKFDLYFTTSQLNFSESAAYLEEYFPHLREKLLKEDNNSIVNITVNVVKYVLDAALAIKPFANIQALKKIKHQLGFVFEYLNMKYSFIPKDKKDFFDIYFSPKYPIPKQILAISSLRKIIFFHDMIPIIYPEYSPRSNRFFYNYLVAQLSNEMLILCNSNTTRNDLLSFRKDIDPNNARVLYLNAASNFKPTTDFSELNNIKQSFNIDPKSKYVLTVSSLNPRKNFPHVIKSFISFIKNNNIKDLYLLVVGPKGWGYEEIFKTIDGMDGYKDKVIITGFVEDDILSSLYAGATAFIYASLYEGFGYPALEAMQCGTPAIIANNSSLPEIVEDAGIQIDPTDQNALVSALGSLYYNTTYRNELAALALQQAKKFSTEAFAENLLAILLK